MILLLINIVFITIIIISLFFYKQIVGWFGEKWTKELMNKLPKDEYKVLNDLLISVNNKTYQIDHVIVSKYGIFSIETKQYNGYITGYKYDKYWIRHSGKEKYYYSNPIRQNYGHCKALSELLNINESNVINIVCIPSKAKLKIDHDGELVRYNDFVDKILSYKDVLINNETDIFNKLLKSNISDKNIRKEHIDNINKNIKQNKEDICPKCGGKFVERESKYGIFKGCSNYPQCKYTRNK